MKYFLHDSNAFSDEKITLLYLKFGFEAVGLFFCILEKLALQEQPINEIVLKSQLNIKKRLEKQLSFMYEIDILSVKNGDVFSKNILKFSEKYQIKKEKTRKRVSEWRDKQEDTESVTRYKRVRNTPKDKISKEKEYKEKNTHKDFYKNEFEKINGDADPILKNGYAIMINALYGKNGDGEEMKAVLKIEKQLSFDNYIKLCKNHNPTKNAIIEILMAMENKPTKIKGNKSLFSTMNNWMGYGK